MAEVQYMDTLAHAKKNLMKAEEMSGGEGYSSRGYSMGDYRGEGSYRDGRSYARGGRRRDAMGRYSSRGYSMAADDMIAELHELMAEAPDEQTKMEFKRFIDKIERM